MPASAAPDAGRLLLARSLRGFADGFISVLLASYLDRLGFSAIQVGAIVTATLLGSAVVTLGVGLFSYRYSPRRILFGATLLMLATGLGFVATTAFWPLIVIAFVGTMNPTAGDVSLFLPIEQSLLSEKVAARDRTALFARYNLGGAFAGALGAFASALPEIVSRQQGWDLTNTERAGFLVYAAAAVVIAIIYLGVRPPERPAGSVARSALRSSRRIVLRLAALFTLDSFGGGFVAQSLLVLWLFRRFDLSTSTAATVFFCAGLLSAFSQLAASRLAARIGLVQTMVFTHLPSNVFMILAALMPTAPLAIGFLLARTALSQMDVPARQSFVMSVVPPEERAAAASVTNVPRSLGTSLSPFLAGALLSWSDFGWPLILSGVLKIIYDLLLLAGFRRVQGLEEPSSVSR